MAASSETDRSERLPKMHHHVDGTQPGVQRASIVTPTVLSVHRFDATGPVNFNVDIVMNGFGSEDGMAAQIVKHVLSHRRRRCLLAAMGAKKFETHLDERRYIPGARSAATVKIEELAK